MCIDDLKQKKIVVTGGAGFIGSNLIEALILGGVEDVISIDNYSTGLRDNHIDGATYIDGETKDIENLLSDVPDIIFHLGEYARTSVSFEDMERVWDYNTHGTFRVLEYCRKNNVRLIYAGSSTKFGDGGEGDNQSPYAWMKARNTELVCRYGEWFDLDYAITYFYNVYGPREPVGKYGTLIAIFAEKMKNNEKLSVVAPGTQKRNFTHVADIVDGIIKVGVHGGGDGYALGHPDSFTIMEVAQMFGGDVEMLPERPGDRAESALDLSKTQELGWVPHISLAQYIKEI